MIAFTPKSRDTHKPYYMYRPYQETIFLEQQPIAPTWLSRAQLGICDLEIELHN